MHHSIAQHIRNFYERLYEGDSTPSARLPIERGKDLAAWLGYPLDILADVPAPLWEHFLPCGNPLPHLQPSAGESILNLGSGIGIDSLALVKTCVSPLHVVNLDVVPKALAQSREMTLRGAEEIGKTVRSRTSWVCAEGDSLPFRPDTFDWILMNGVFNLFPDKPRLLAEIHRTLKASGRMVIVDLSTTGELPKYFAEEWDGWAWCMSGACTGPQLTLLIEAAGLAVEFLKATDEADLLHSMILVARKPSSSPQGHAE